MVRFGQLVLGPAGCGKSTYSAAIHTHYAESKRTVHVVNLDPAAEEFHYPVAVDIRELISVQDVAEELKLGPNGGLVFCMEYLLDNLEWMDDQMEGFGDDDYLIFDCPGQIELYTHFPFMSTLVSWLQTQWDFRLCAVYLLDSQFMVDPAKFFGGSLTALSAMVQLEVPHINILSKMDLVKGADKARLEEFMVPDVETLVEDLTQQTSKKFLRLNQAMGQLIDEFNMVNFHPLDSQDPDSIDDILLQIDLALQFEETAEVRTAEFDPPGQDDDS